MRLSSVFVLVVITCSSCIVEASPPNIIVIIADDMGWNDVSFHGSSQILTPNLDALAYEGVILNRHYVMPTCSPSRSALLTGRYPVHTGIQFPIGSGTPNALPLNHTLLPQYLQRLGYQTHLVGKWHLGSHRTEYLPTRRGFQSHFGFWNGFLGYYDGIHLEAGLVGIDARRNEKEAWPEFAGHYLTDLLAKEAESVVKAHNSYKGPLFLELALSAPHTGNKGEELQVRDEAENDRVHSHINDTHRRLYAGMVRGVDDAVGVVIKALRDQDLLNNSIVLFTSDNGAPTEDLIWGYHNYGSNWPLRGMKKSCHDGGVRAAALLWSPLVRGGRVSQDLIHISDWLPTFYSAAGGNVKELGTIDGVDQWQTLVGGSGQKRTELLVELNSDSGNEAIISWPWKLVKYSAQNSFLNKFAGESGRGDYEPEYTVAEVSNSLAAQAINSARSPAEMITLRSQATIDGRCSLVVSKDTGKVGPCVDHHCLFNLEDDPCETVDLAPSNAPLVTSLHAALDVYRRTLVPVLPDARQVDPHSHPHLWGQYWTTWADSGHHEPSAATLNTPSSPTWLSLLLTALFSYSSVLTCTRHTQIYYH